MRVLAIGDFHIPDRAFVVPAELDASISRAAKRQNFDLVACTGDLTKTDQLEPFLASWSQEYCVVQGNMDYDLRNAKGFPRSVVFDTRKFIRGFEVLKIGLTHGHQISLRGDPASLADLAKEMGVHVLISGHSHASSITLHQRAGDGQQVLLLNPGSATGAWSFVASLVPSFMVLDIEPSRQGIDVETMLVEFRDGKEEKISDTHTFKNGTFIK
jgi:putative phosphoesterase